jgi:hypothetical protein
MHMFLEALLKAARKSVARTLTVTKELAGKRALMNAGAEMDSPRFSRVLGSLKGLVGVAPMRLLAIQHGG